MEEQHSDQLCDSKTTESVLKMEKLSSKDLNGIRSSKSHGSREIYLVHQPLSSPTFDQHTISFESSAGKNRLVSKSGSLKVTAKNVPQKAKRYFADLFTSMIDLNWPGVIFVFCASYVISWVVFGFIWWILVAVRGPSVCVTGVNQHFFLFLFHLPNYY